MRTTIQRKSNTNVKNVMKFSCNVVKENYTWRQFIWKIYTTAYNVRKHFHIKMNMWWLIIWSFNIVLHYYHKYVKAGVSPVSNSKCASGNRALEKFPRFRKVSFSKVLFGNFSGNVWKFPILNCASGNRALKISKNQKSFLGKFLRNCASSNRARNCASGYVEPRSASEERVSSQHTY